MSESIEHTESAKATDKERDRERESVRALQLSAEIRTTYANELFIFDI